MDEQKKTEAKPRYNAPKMETLSPAGNADYTYYYYTYTYTYVY